MPRAAAWCSGVCNGFQILAEAGHAAGRAAAQCVAALPVDGLPSAGGAGGHARSPATTSASQVFRAPLAHGDGNYFADSATIDRLEGEGLVAFRYVNPAGEVTAAANRNGSRNAIAGILSPDLRICGLMPHPEDLVDPLLGGEDGKPLFDGLVAALAA